MTKTAKTKIVPGKTQFRSIYADSNALWTVISQKGADTWLCQIIGNGDYDGTQKAFLTEEIEGSIRQAEAFKELRNDNDAFYRSLQLGQIIHYHNGFNCWIRCEVVEEAGEKKLLPFALVGEWRAHDLPRRTKDGSIDLGFNAKMIIERETFAPNYGFLLESGQMKLKNGIDPRTLTPINLTVPEMTQEETETAELWQRVNKIRTALDQRDPRKILADIKNLVK